VNWIRNLRVIATTPLIVLLALTGFALADFTTPHTFVNGTVADADQVNENFTAIANTLDALDARLAQLESTAAVGPGSALRIVYGEVDADGTVLAGTGFSAVPFTILGFTAISSGPWGETPKTFVEVPGTTLYKIATADNTGGGNITILDPGTDQPVFVKFRFVQIGVPQP
jgi:hypothetical protein